MSLTIGLAGMDPATEAALKAAFLEANQRLAGTWQLLPETQADHIVVDMDSMYGPMSWLRLHASGKRVVGLTSAMRTQTDFRLGRPFSVDSLAELLREIGGATGAPATIAPEADHAPAVDAPAPEVRLAEAAPAVPMPAAHAAPPPASVAPAPLPAEPTPATAAPPAPAPDMAPAAPVPPAASPSAPATLLGWLTSGQLRGRLRYRRPSGPTLLVDADIPAYHGPSALKPLAQYFEGEVAREDLEPVDDATWDQETTVAGAPQPLARLIWLGALVSGKGALLPGHDPDARYQLNRWPQTEREFPRHFRIATAMMKGPAKLQDVAAASGIALEDIVDFVNANLATGVAEPVPEQPSEPATAPRSGGLLGRLRGR
ncbi:hypothetical protein [Luteimonas kalidii]|uniref:Uncharacterized protein n=1 Tax=Luteimonas kalidii TaxID=3042025 RepID=A0ABT6JZH8_9GAMM|nr:hypothetical protein [Luteimonas kalidii]MDH5835581.1 hypothetical protein [Luteimonas kalidii]